MKLLFNKYFYKSFLLNKMSTTKPFSKTLNKLGNIIAKLDNKLGLESSFGKQYSTKPDLSSVESIVNTTNNEKENKKDKTTTKKEEKKEKIVKEKKENVKQTNENTNNTTNNTNSNKEQTKENKESKDTKDTKESKDSIKDLKKIDENFSAIDFRVGKVEKIINMEGSENLFHCWVDVGEGELREIGCGLRKYGVSSSEFTDENIVVFANLKPKKLASIMSNGMILCCEDPESKQFEVVRPPKDAAPGDRVYLDGGKVLSEKADFLSANKFSKAVPLLKSDNDCTATYNGVKLVTSKGYVHVKKFKNCPIS